MIVLFWIVAIIVFALGISLWVKCEREDIPIGPPVIGFLFIFFGIMMIFGLAGLFNEIPKPKPIDVYRGKTTLRVTYQDTIPVDTVVIWKTEFEPKTKK